MNILEEIEIFKLVNIYMLSIGFILGIVAQKSKFCFSGAIKDTLLHASTKRISSIIVAMISAIIFTRILSQYFELDLSTTMYLKENLNYIAIIFGGLLFGLGMMLADGCGFRHIVKFAQGDLSSLAVLIFFVIGIYLTTQGIFSPYLSSFSKNDTLLSFAQILPNFQMNIYFILILLVSILLYFMRTQLKNMITLYDGIIIGFLVSLGWYVTGIIGSESMERTISLGSLSFVAPTENLFNTITHFQSANIKYGAFLVIGVFIGSFLLKLIAKKSTNTSCNIQANPKDLRNKIIGGILMGMGGVLTIGCTIGQGLSGLSTLSFASFVSIISILFGASLYTKMFIK